MDLSPVQNHVNNKYRCTQGEIIQAYTECYRKIYTNYKEDIKEIHGILKSIDKEEIDFYENKIPQIIKKLKKDDLIDEEVQKAWINKMCNNINDSLNLSRKIIEDFIGKKSEELAKELKSDLESVRLYG